MASDNGARHFDASLGCLYSSSVDELAAQLSDTDIDQPEREVILSAVRDALYSTLYAKLGRLLVLELNAARVSGHLQGEDTYARWCDFLRISSQPEFWRQAEARYPTLAGRVRTIIEHRCSAGLSFARHFAADRAALDALVDGDFGALRKLSFGAGDTHQGGKTVAMVDGDGGSVVYKPRSLRIDTVLREFVARLQGWLPLPSSVRVPKAIDRGDHGWSEFVPHRYAEGEAELGMFYRGIGHWLAVMRLLHGNDLHAENLIAHGANPFVIDCETLFIPTIPGRATGMGDAFDLAGSLLSGSVLGVGLLPGRGLGLGWRGVDNSALGMLPGEQPMIPVPAILDAGTDQARVGMQMVEAPMALNHPSPEPALAKYWPEVLEGFDEVTAAFKAQDAAGSLEPALSEFSKCLVRFVPRGTEVYTEVGRMLWHPVSLHDHAPAIARAQQLLAKMVENVSTAPDTPEVIQAEVEDLLVGDIPYFTTIVERGDYDGPGGTRWLTPCDLLQDALRDWRGADFGLERHVIQASLVSAYINDGWTPGEVALKPKTIRIDDLDRRRRVQAAGIMRTAIQTAIRGEDGTVAWIAPILEPRGWAVQPIGQDLYGGISGVAILAAAYQREAAAGRADPVEGLDALLESCLKTLVSAEDYRRKLGRNGFKVRPPAPGGYIGLGSQIWAWLTLARWGMDGGRGLDDARTLAESLEDAAAADDTGDLLIGSAGAIVPLLQLAAHTGESRWRELAMRLGDRVCERASIEDGKARWPSSQWPKGLGGFAHGSTGIGWALSRLAKATGQARYGDMAESAFAFERSLFSVEEQNWRDMRMEEIDIVASAWCHGAVGIGIAHLDLDPELRLPRTREIAIAAAAAACKNGMGWNHTVCHGDVGAWELIVAVMRRGLAPADTSGEALLGRILSSLEEYGPVSGFARNTFSPGLVSGVGGVAYQLLRAHPEHDLPSVMTLAEA
jgi:type 2 lantibiotic biosynthesis protein LanM